MLLRACLAFGLILSAFSAGAADTPAKETNAQKFVRLTRELERDPFSDRDKSKRAWLLMHAIDSKDIMVTVCDVLGPLPSDNVPHGGELVMQAMFGNAAFQLEHPHTRDEQAMQVAGMESLLSAYASILNEEPAARIPYFDEMQAKQAKGELAAPMAPAIKAKCTETPAT